nr:hypothetical protein [Tanacetum cinerariifolium]
MVFVSSPSTNRTNEVPIAYGVSTADTQPSTASTQVNIASSQTSTNNLSDATMYAFLANQSNGSQLVHEDLDQIYKDDLKGMDLKWQLALLSMRAKWTVNVEETPSKAMVVVDGVGFDWSYMTEDEVPTNMALMAFIDSEIDLSYSGLKKFQQPKFQSYRSKSCETESNNASKEIPNELKESPDANCNYHHRERVVSRNNLQRPVNAAHPKTTVYSARPILRFSKSAQSTVKRPYQQRTSFTNKSFRQTVNTARPRPVNTARPRPVNIVRLRPVNTARPNSVVVNAIRVNQVNVVKASAWSSITGARRSRICYLWGGANGGRITGKGTLNIGKLDFEDLYFVKELKFNLLSVS